MKYNMAKVNPIRKTKETPKMSKNALSTPATKLDACAVDDRIYIAFI
jgi:hypothetical protein